MNSVLLATSLGVLIAQGDTLVVSLVAKPIGTALGSPIVYVLYLTGTRF